MGNSQSFTSYEDELLKQVKPRAYEVPNSAEKGATSIYRCFDGKDGFPGYLKDVEEKNEIELDTAWKLFKRASTKYGNKDFVGHRPYLDEKDTTKRGDYKWIKYKAFYDNYVIPWGLALKSLSLECQTNICIFSQNRPEWYGCHMGNLSQSYVTVALYDTLGPKGVAYTISHAETQLIVCEKDKLETLFNAIKLINETLAKGDDEKNDSWNSNYNTYKTYKLKYIIQFDANIKEFNNLHETIDNKDVATAKDFGIELLAYSTLLSKFKPNNNDNNNNKDNKGLELKLELNEPKKEDKAYIMYTSGTTGTPKGVILSHGAFAAMVATATRLFNPNENDCYISYLPLAHIFETAGQSVVTSKGGKVGYFNGDIRYILNDWKSLRPTFLVGVPRVFSKTYDKFEANKSKLKGIKKKLVESASIQSAKKIKDGKRSGFYDKLVWKKIPVEIGFDKVRLLVSGAAPLPAHIQEFLKIILPNAKVLQGYGMTEADDKCLGHVGVAGDNLEVRLIDAPECDYLTTDKPYPRGEIQIRGMCTMDGYFKNEAATKKTLTEDGWINTGDIGRVNPNNTISIIDRRKNLFKLINGEYIASEKVENEYCKIKSIGQCFIYANSHKSFIVGIIVPEAAPLMKHFIREDWITEKDIADGNLLIATEEYAKIWSDICTKHEKEVKELIEHDIKEWKKSGQAGLAKFEFIKDFHVETQIDQVMQGFTIENECLTPTYKKKRPNLTKRYLEQIKKMYADHGEPPKQGEHWL